MDKDQLPLELLEIEHQLHTLPRAEPPESLRERTVVHLRQELQDDRLRNRWSYAVAVAVSVLIWINLSLSASLVSKMHLDTGANQQAIKNQAHQIQQLLPEISGREAYRHALILNTRPALSGQPEIPSSNLFRQQSFHPDNGLYLP